MTRDSGSAIRVGQGFDVHAFGEGSHVPLCGVRVPHVRGVVAHSDGDVALHALCDAILGALALGDIGQHFPPGDECWTDADSRGLLRSVMAMATRDGWCVGNADITILAEAPKISPHSNAMRELLAEDLDCAVESISVKATTTERLGFTGREEGIAAWAIVLLVRGDA